MFDLDPVRWAHLRMGGGNGGVWWVTFSQFHLPAKTAHQAVWEKVQERKTETMITIV